jgi:hypothetical protein
VHGSIGGLGITATFPVDDNRATLLITLQRASDPPPVGGWHLLGQVFSITAEDEQGNPVTHFDPPLTLTLAYSPELLAGMNEADLLLHYWDGGAGGWEPIATSAENGILTVSLDHLTNFAVLEVPQTRIYLPSLHR